MGRRINPPERTTGLERGTPERSGAPDRPDRPDDAATAEPERAHEHEHAEAEHHERGYHHPHHAESHHYAEPPHAEPHHQAEHHVGEAAHDAEHHGGAAATTHHGHHSPEWTFLTNHAHVLICIGCSPDARIRDIADEVGITERAVQLIIADLEKAGYLTREREGRRNHYVVRGDLPLRHPIERHRQVAALLDLGVKPSR